MLRLPAQSQPTKSEETTPATRLDGEKKGLTNKLTNPPKKVENTPKYAPRIMPINGAIIVAAVMALLNKPTN
jgi:hypothetical protein